MCCLARVYLTCDRPTVSRQLCEVCKILYNMCIRASEGGSKTHTRIFLIWCFLINFSVEKYFFLTFQNRAPPGKIHYWLHSRINPSDVHAMCIIFFWFFKISLNFILRFCKMHLSNIIWHFESKLWRGSKLDLRSAYRASKSDRVLCFWAIVPLHCSPGIQQSGSCYCAFVAMVDKLNVHSRLRVLYSDAGQTGSKCICK